MTSKLQPWCQDKHHQNVGLAATPTSPRAHRRRGWASRSIARPFMQNERLGHTTGIADGHVAKVDLRELPMHGHDAGLGLAPFLEPSLALHRDGAVQVLAR